MTWLILCDRIKCTIASYYCKLIEYHTYWLLQIWTWFCLQFIHQFSTSSRTVLNQMKPAQTLFYRSTDSEDYYNDNFVEVGARWMNLFNELDSHNWSTIINYIWQCHTMPIKYSHYNHRKWFGRSWCICCNDADWFPIKYCKYQFYSRRYDFESEYIFPINSSIDNIMSTIQLIGGNRIVDFIMSVINLQMLS